MKHFRVSSFHFSEHLCSKCQSMSLNSVKLLSWQSPLYLMYCSLPRLRCICCGMTNSCSQLHLSGDESALHFGANRDFVLNYDDDEEYAQRTQSPQSDGMDMVLLGNNKKKFKKSWSAAVTCDAIAAQWNRILKVHASVWWANKQRQCSPGDIKK